MSVASRRARPEVTEAEELDRVVPVVAGLVARFDTPVSVDTWRASVARASYAEGAVMGNDISGLADPDYAPAAAEFDAAVVITHIRLARAWPIPIRTTTTLSPTWPASSPNAPTARWPPACRPSGSCSMLASTSARPPSSL